MIKTKNFINGIFTTSVKDYIKKNGAGSIKSNHLSTFKNGKIVLKTSEDSVALQTLLSDLRYISNPRLISEKEKISIDDFHIYMKNIMRSSDCSYGRFNYSYLFNDAKERIIKFDTPMEFDECLNIAIAFRNKLGSKFFGCLLKIDGIDDMFINPFHALTAISIISNINTFNKENLNVFDENIKFIPIIYILNDEELMDLTYMSELADLETIDKNINFLIQQYRKETPIKNKVTYTNENDINDENIFDFIKGKKKIEIKYKTTDKTQSSESIEHYIVAHQASTKGTIIPSYGASYVKIDRNQNESRGVNLNPFTTCNIAGTYNYYHDEVVLNSVCTGSNHHRTTIDGLRELTYSNYGSPYNSSSMFTAGALLYSRKMIEKSLQLYRLSKLIEFKEPEDVTIDYEKLLSEIVDFRNSIGLDFVENLEQKDFDDIGNAVYTYRESLKDLEKNKIEESSEQTEGNFEEELDLFEEENPF